MGSPNVPLPESIIRFLDEAQNSTSTQHKLVNGLAALYNRADDHKRFFEAFFPPFSNVLLVYKREPAVERVITFISKFAAKVTPKEKDKENSDLSSSDDEGESTFLSFFIDKLLLLHESKEKAVRFRVCQLVAKLLSEATDSSCKISSELLDRVQTVMLLRVQDKIPVVRVHAVTALQFFQEEMADCPVVAILLELMEKDSSPEVRRCVLNNIITTDQSLAAVIQRTSDIKEQIRRDAFLWISSKCGIKHLTIRRRIHLLNIGLHDHSEMVVEACVKGLLRQWSLECNDGDFLSLLSRLDVEHSSEVVELALLKLFAEFSVKDLVSSMRNVMDTSNGVQPRDKDKPESQDSSDVCLEPQSEADRAEGSGAPPNLLSREFMLSEEVFYWSCLCRYLHKEGAEAQEGLDKLLPTLSEFADYVHSYMEEVVLAETDDEAVKSRSEFVGQQLCSMLPLCDLTDEHGRSRVADMVCNVLSHPRVPVVLIPPLLCLQTTIWPEERQRIEKLVEIIAEQRQPSMPVPGGVASTSECSSQPQEDADASVVSPASTFANDEVDTLLRCLTVTCELLKGLRRRRLDNPVLLTLADSLLFPCIQNVNPYVRDMALHCLGLACLMDPSIAKKHILLFVQVTQVDHDMVRATALKVVCDLLHVYGFEAFSVVSPDDNKPSEDDEEEVVEDEGSEKEEEAENDGYHEGDKNSITQKLLTIMVNFLDGESPLLRDVACEGICKLLLNGRVLSQKLLAKLLLLWYNPITEEETDLRSILGLFFLAFASLGRNSRVLLSEVYLPVMRKIFEAPPTSPLASVDTNNLSDFVLQLTQPVPGSAEESVHNALAIAVCNECLKDLPSADCRTYCRTLSLMTLTSSNMSNVSDLLALCCQMEEVVGDRTSLRYLKKFKDPLTKICPQHSSRERGSKLGDTSGEAANDSEATKSEAVGGASSPGNKTQDNSVCNGHVVEDKEERGMTNGELSSHKLVPLREVRVSLEKMSLEAIQQATVAKSSPPQREVKKSARKPRTTRSKKTIRVSRLPSSEEDEESASENIVPEDIGSLPKRVSHHRAAKIAASRQYVDSPLREISYQTPEDSDDSIIGEHSPFVKHTSRRTRSSCRTVQPLCYDDDDDDDA